MPISPLRPHGLSSIARGLALRVLVREAGMNLLVSSFLISLPSELRSHRAVVFVLHARRAVVGGDEGSTGSRW